MEIKYWAKMELSRGIFSSLESYPPEVFLGKGVLKICIKFAGDNHAEV